LLILTVSAEADGLAVVAAGALLASEGADDAAAAGAWFVVEADKVSMGAIAFKEIGAIEIGVIMVVSIPLFTHRLIRAER
jgi:hypothetical protein